MTNGADRVFALALRMPRTLLPVLTTFCRRRASLDGRHRVICHPGVFGLIYLMFRRARIEHDTRGTRCLSRRPPPRTGYLDRTTSRRPSLSHQPLGESLILT